MNHIEIRKIRDDDIPEVVDLWYDVSIQAHDFIPEGYWQANKTVMKRKYIPMSETYLATRGDKILGFISLVDNYLAAIFVRQEIQGNGVGSSLLDYGKKLRNNLQLKVYSKNTKSIEFYKARGFSVISESEDDGTGANEIVMEWKNADSCPPKD